MKLKTSLSKARSWMKLPMRANCARRLRCWTSLSILIGLEVTACLELLAVPLKQHRKAVHGQCCEEAAGREAIGIRIDLHSRVMDER